MSTENCTNSSHEKKDKVSQAIDFLISYLLKHSFSTTFIVFGLWLVLTNVQNIIEFTSTSNWIETTGVVERIDCSVGHSNEYGPVSYEYSVNYKYQVADHVFHSNYYSVMTEDIAGSNFTSFQDIRSVTSQKYPVDGSVKVFYDPDHHEKSMLLHELSSSVYTTIIGGFGIILMGLYLKKYGLC